MTGKIKIIIADDHPMVIDGLSDYLNTSSHIVILAATNNIGNVVPLLEKHNPDILLIDYHFNNSTITGLDVCRKVVSVAPEVKVIVISSFLEVRLINDFMEAGAAGYLLKTATRSEYIEAINNVFAGGEWFSKDVRELLVKEKLQNQGNPVVKFTQIEKEILKLIIDGCSTREIASRLFREKSTIDSHRKIILAKLQMRDKNHNPSKNILHYITRFNISRNLDNL